MILVLFIVMGLIFMMSYFKFQTTLATLIQNRLTVISITMGESIESAIDLGLRLAEMRTAEEVIARAATTPPGIASIQIFDNNGQILYSTQKEMAGTKCLPMFRKPRNNLKASPPNRETSVNGGRHYDC